MINVRNLNINGLGGMEEHYLQILSEEIRKKMMIKM